MIPSNRFQGKIWGGIHYQVQCSPSLSIAAEDQLQSEVLELLSTIESVFSPCQRESELNLLNQKSSFTKLSPHLEAVFLKSQQICRETSGAFNPAVMPALKKWGFSAELFLGEVLPGIDFDSCNVKNGMLIKSDEAMQFDFCGIAKGYAVDLIAQHLDQVGIQNYLIEIGGEISVKGKNPRGKEWAIGIQIPDSTQKMVIRAENRAVATSGDEYRSKIIHGRKQVHTIDPSTQAPLVSKIRSVTVFASNCTEADAYATAFWLKGMDWTFEFLKSRPELDVVFIFEKESGLAVRMSTGAEQKRVAS